MKKTVLIHLTSLALVLGIAAIEVLDNKAFPLNSETERYTLTLNSNNADFSNPL